MKTSTITLYYKSLLNKDKNFILDDPANGKSMVETYLATLQKETITGFQYVKHAVSLTIKINKNQQILNMGKDADDLNYIKIQNDGENPKFYFIIGKNWKAEESIELVLNMDTLNSFRFNKDYEINAKTFVKREHRDRFNKYNTITFDWTMYCPELTTTSSFHTDLNLSNCEIESFSWQRLDGPSVILNSDIFLEAYTDSNGIKGFRLSVHNRSYFGGDVNIRVTYKIRAYYRNIDLKSEEINCPVYKYDEDPIFEQEGRSSINFSLFYRNRTTDANAPVDCYLLPDVGVGAVYQTSDGKVNSSNTPENGDYIIFWSNDSAGFSINVNGTDYPIKKSSGWSYGTYQNWSLIACRKIDENTIEVYQAKMEYKVLFFPQIPTFSGAWQKIYSGAYIQVQTLQDTMGTRRVASLPNSSTWCLDAIAGTPVGSNFDVNFGTTATATILSVTNIDKTDSKNIKIIDVPYCPSSYVLDADNNLVLPSLWNLDTNNYMMKLRNLNARFENDITSGSRNVLIDFIQSIPAGDITTMKRFLKDSKLYHSDYYRTKFVYDSFSKTFELEKIDFIPNKDESNLFKFRFVMSRNIVSKFLFKFFYKYKVAVEDYENIVAVSRNNEEVLYNSQYLNYIRTGYNYDLKAKERQDTSSAVGIGLSALGMVASIVIAVATENPLPIAGAVASGLSLVGQTANYAKQTAQNEENIQRKLQEAQQQAVSVMNADDVDLLFEYSGNKAKLCYYKASDRMMDILDDLFYYGGYITNEQKIPVVNTRYWFNFVQASLVLEETNNLTEEIENDIKEKFENGVTFLHYRQNTFDFKQEMENIEKKLV